MSRNKNVSLKCPICKFPNDKGDRQIDDLRKQITVLKAENAELREAVESALRSLDAANDPERAIEWLEAVLDKYKS